ncbi:hypothetical protein CSC17_1524 [Klebsiella oxytoca]|nr:hypothetical protein CSC17_1524 [Klebsiella oxytoca]
MSAGKLLFKIYKEARITAMEDLLINNYKHIRRKKLIIIFL